MNKPYQTFIDTYRSDFKNLPEVSNEELIACLLQTPDEYIKDFKDFYPTEKWSTYRMRKEAQFFREVVARQLTLRFLQKDDTLVG